MNFKSQLLREIIAEKPELLEEQQFVKTNISQTEKVCMQWGEDLCSQRVKSVC